MDYLNDLNRDQRRAAEHTQGPLLIVAGAGTGKTKTLTYRILNLIQQGVDPSSILAITFTNKAAREMRDRIEKLLGNDALAQRARSPGRYRGGRIQTTGPFVGTFHALCAYILRGHASLLNLPRHFSIFDRNDSVSAMREAIRAAGFEPKQYDPTKLLGALSRQKGDAITRERFENELSEKKSFDRVIAAAWKEYETILKREKALDFDDLLLQTLELLKQHADIREYYRSLFRYIHIDEYQDTNKVQYELSRLIAGKENNICVVGDHDQSIYGWRGADIKNIFSFERDYPDSAVITLEKNYRSTKQILSAANAVIEKTLCEKRKDSSPTIKKGSGSGSLGRTMKPTKRTSSRRARLDLLKKAHHPER